MVVPMSEQRGEEGMAKLAGHWRRAAGPWWKGNIIWERSSLS